MEQLPPEVVCHVLDLVSESLVSLGRLRRVSRLWCQLIDSTPALWARYTEIDIVDSRITSAGLERLCTCVARVEKVRLVRCAKVLQHPLLDLLASPLGSSIQSLCIENCSMIVSGGLDLAAVIRQCPRLKTLVFTCDGMKLDKASYDTWLARGPPLAAALDAVRPPLRLFRTNVILPTVSLLTCLSRHCAQVELRDHFKHSTRDSSDSPLRLDVLVSGSLHDGRTCWGKLELGRLLIGRSRRIYIVLELATGRRHQLTGHINLCCHLTLKQYQLIGVEGMYATLLDDEGVVEDVQLSAHWHEMLNPLFVEGVGVKVVLLDLPEMGWQVFQMIVDSS